MITIFGNYGSDVEGFSDDKTKHSIRTRINKRPIDIMRDIYANYVAKKPDVILQLRAFGDHLPMFSKILKALKNCDVKLLDPKLYFDDSNLLVVEITIGSDIPIKFIQPEALRLVKTGYGDDSKFALENVAPGKDE